MLNGQDLAALAIVAAALLWIARKYVFKPAKAGCATGCPSCPISQGASACHDQPVVISLTSLTTIKR